MLGRITAGLRWGLAIGVAGALFLLAIDGIGLSEVPWFLGSWILLGLIFGILVHWSYEDEKSEPDRAAGERRSVAAIPPEPFERERGAEPI